jgi:hypothetical protein
VLQETAELVAIDYYFDGMKKYNNDDCNGGQNVKSGLSLDLCLAPIQFQTSFISLTSKR